jgi:hypothetical protein
MSQEQETRETTRQNELPQEGTEPNQTPSGYMLLLSLLGIVIFVLILFVSFIILSLYFMPVTWLPPVPPDVIAARGQFGDMFGFITALFTGLGFAGIAVTLYAQWRTLDYQSREAVSREQERTKSQNYLAEQLKLLKESTEAETRAVKMQRSSTSIDVLTRLFEKFDSKELRNSRYLASKYFLDAVKSRPAKLNREVADDAAIRDILLFFEHMARFINRGDLEEEMEEEMVLLAFYGWMEAYWHFAEETVLPDLTSTIDWIETRNLRQRLPEWLRAEHVKHGLHESEDEVPEENVQLPREELIRVLEREVVRCKENAPLRGFLTDLH